MVTGALHLLIQRYMDCRKGEVTPMTEATLFTVVPVTMCLLVMVGLTV